MFGFGQGVNPPVSLVEKELALVKRVDPLHPVVTTDSGELSTWLHFVGQTDGLGISIYRKVMHPLFGTISYSLVPPVAYARKAALLGRWTGPVFVSEFQMEPWATRPLTELTNEEIGQAFNAREMEDRFAFAQRLHLSPVYFWGAEWWLWMKQLRNHPEYWDAARAFFIHP